MNEKPIYLPGLNALRSIAAFSVIVCHLFYMDIGEKFLIDWGIAHYAVTMFFVISGFLITFLLLKEKEKTNTIKIKKFYFRRILRIWPIYFLYLLIISILMILDGNYEIFLSPSFLSFIFISGNLIAFFSTIGMDSIVHFWSIGVEEQFYLFWPWANKLSASINKLLNIIIISIVSLLSIKFLIYFIYGTHSDIYIFIKQTRFQCMLIGAIGALMFFNNNKLFINITSNKILQLISWLFYFALGLNYIYFPPIIAHEFVAIATLIIIIGQIHNPLFKLESKLFNFFGKISYGLYVVHPLILILFAKIFIQLEMNMYLKWTLFFTLSSSFSVLLAWLSFKYFESYFLKFKTKFAMVKSTNVKSN